MPGPGQIVLLHKSTNSFIWLLYNFDIGSSSLKPEHKSWVQANLSSSRQRRGDISFSTVGLASRIGPDALNTKLSKARSDAVQSAVFLLNPGKLPDTSEVYVGEKAAQLIGIRDGADDERWRGVVLSIFEGKPAKVKTVQPQARTFVPRLSHVVALLSEEDSGVNAGIEDGGPGFRAGQAFNRMRNPNGLILSRTTQEVDERFWLLRVTAEEKSTTSGIPIIANTTHTYLHVHYEWGPGTAANGAPVKREYVINSNVGFGVPKTRVYPMDPLTANYWIDSPVGTYDTLPR